VTQDSQGEPARDFQANAAVDATVANQARIYDYWLGGRFL
jgi:hypothetical protein